MKNKINISSKIALIFILVFSCAYSVSAVSIPIVTLTNINSTFATVTISNPNFELYAYEINVDFTGNLTSIKHGDYLVRLGTSEKHCGENPDVDDCNNGDSVYGNALETHYTPNWMSIYASRLDNLRNYRVGDGTLFNITHTGNVSLRYALFIDNQAGEKYDYYNGNSPASSLNMKIETNLKNHDGYAYDFRLMSNPDSSIGFDGYDFPSPPMPSNYSEFCSFVGGMCLSIDSFPPSALPRTVNMIYNISDSLSDNVTFSWNQQVGYSLTIKDYGTDSSYSNLIRSVDMSSTSSYEWTMTAKKTYFQILVSSVAGVPSGNGTAGGGNGGAGGGENNTAPIIHYRNETDGLIRVMAIKQPKGDANQYSDLTRAILFSEIKNFIEKGATESLNPLVVSLNNAGITMSEDLLKYWIDNFQHENYQSVEVKESEYNKFNLVNAEKFLNIVFSVDPNLIDESSFVNLCKVSDSQTWTKNIQTTRRIDSCEVVEGIFDCKILDSYNAQIIYKVPYFETLTKEVEGSVRFKSMEGDLATVKISKIKFVNKCGSFDLGIFKLKAWMILAGVIIIIVIILGFILILRKRKINKSHKPSLTNIGSLR